MDGINKIGAIQFLTTIYLITYRQGLQITGTGNKMENRINRRKFIRTTAATSAAAIAAANGFRLFASPGDKTLHTIEFSAAIPIPIQVVIDDVGWWSGYDGSEMQEPYRSGINRNHVSTDYTAIVELGKRLGIRPQAAIVLCEWDKKNILRKLPTATWMGKAWDNSKWVGSWMEEAAEIIRNNEKHLELTLHGVGHEYWTDGKFTRAEWADENGWMRLQEQVEKHLDFFEKLMQQHQLGPFPTSFVPTAFLHGFGQTPGHNVSMAEILSKRGIKYINTPFHNMYNANAVKYKYFGFDTDVLTIDRGKDVLPWNATGVTPTGCLPGLTCGMHWANLIHPDPNRNSEVVKSWGEFLLPYQDREETMLASDSGSFQSQLLYHECTEMTQNGNTIQFDFRKTDRFQGNKLKETFTIKIKSKFDFQIFSDSLEVLSQSLKKLEEYFIQTFELKRKLDVSESSLKILV
jgi:hypothetical protein